MWVYETMRGGPGKAPLSGPWAGQAMRRVRHARYVITCLLLLLLLLALRHASEAKEAAAAAAAAAAAQHAAARQHAAAEQHPAATAGKQRMGAFSSHTKAAKEYFAQCSNYKNYTSQLYKRTYRNTCTRQSANVKSSTKQKQLYTCMSIYTPRTVTAREVDKQYKTT